MITKFNTILNALRHVEQAVMTNLFGKFPPGGGFAMAYADVHPIENSPKKFCLKDIMDGFLLAVPKSRRTLEKRLKRKYGHPDYVWKMLVPKTNIRVCMTCGHHHEYRTICGNCYKEVEKETKEIQTRMQSTGLKPIEKDVVVLYEGETLPEERAEFWKGKRIIEMKKERPKFFSKNLLQKTTQQPSDSTDVKPTELA